MSDITLTTPETGVAYVANLDGWNGYTNTDFTAEKSHRLRGNIHGRGPLDKLANEIFPDDPTVEAVDNEGNPAPDLQRELTQMVMAEVVDVPTKMRLGFSDRCWMGAGIFNWVWEKVGSKYVLTQLVHLQARTFDTLPPGCVTVYSPTLQGIVIGRDTKEIEFWQRQGMALQPTKLDSRGIFMVLDPADGEIAGDPLIRPVAPFLEMLAFTYNATMQYVNQMAVKPLFIKITAPQGASAANGNVGDVEYAQLVLKHYGKDARFPIRANMELIWPMGAESSQSITDIINLLIKVIVDYTSPSNQLAKSGTLIGGSSQPEANLMTTYIRGHHRWIEAAFNRILKRYCDLNGYTEKGFSARFVIPTPDADKSTLKLLQAKEGAEKRTISKNEHRALIEHDALTPEELVEIADDWASSAPPPSFAFGNAVPVTNARETDAFDHHARIAGTTYSALDEAFSALEKGLIAGLTEAA